MPCRACGLDHPSMMLCGVAKRIASNAATNTVANTDVANTSIANKGWKKWREANPEKYRERQREYMRRRRAA